MAFPLPERPVIAASWKRVRNTGLQPDDRPDPTLHDVSGADPLLDAARPVLARAAEMLHGTQTALLLVDHASRMVTRVCADGTLERSLTDSGAVAGADFTESAMGTTALGTTAEVRGDLTINSSEHYLEQFRALSCFGRPIIHPGTRRVAGILCMTEMAEQVNPLSVPLVRGIAHDIGERLLTRSHSDHRMVISAFEYAADRRDVAVAALGDDLQLTNSLAAQLLSPADFGTLRLLLDEPRLPPSITLVSGVVVDIATDKVPSVRHAAVFRLRPHLEPLAPSVPAAPRAVATARTVAVSGEPGTGRTTRAFTVIPREDAIVIDVPTALLNDDPVDLPAALREARSAGRGVVIDGADLLDERRMRLLQSAVTSRLPAEPPLVVVTGPSDALAPSASALIARCREQITLPPLRHRTTEIAALCQEALHARTPPMELAADAANALASQEWPGNLSELMMVLGDAARTARTRGTRTVTLAELPARYRTPSRASRLLGLEQAERRAIVDALDAADGNKSHAAKSLGISRTTLYARMRSFGIH
ncbi:MAG: helix-turn-helix domain-containing protein [Gordonia sp. (in: high G+C Gram-positive bacteria)]|uniref:sigma-54-dependent Fis family transcriptional regulator n=1 Tax=Gordonia sp. (in: high G+C Gram-positive bacteria) TaxID=84139 RepID=UPI0039E6B6DF